MKPIIRNAAWATAPLVLTTASFLGDRWRGNADAQHLFNLLALTLALTWFMVRTRGAAWRPVVAAAVGVGAIYAFAVVVVGMWVGRDDHYSSLGLVVLAMGYSLILAVALRFVWRRRSETVSHDVAAG